MGRHTTLILLAVLLLIGIASAYMYKMEPPTLFQNSDFGLNLAISENNEGRSVSQICVGDTHDVVGLVDYGATFSGMRITSTCDKYTGSYDCTPSEYNVISGSTASGAISFLTSGESNTIHTGSNFRGETASTAFTQNERSIIDKITRATIGAKLAQDLNRGTNVEYARSSAGVGCYGTYSIRITRPDGTQATKSGSLHELAGETWDFMFVQEGGYTIRYETRLEECASLMKEQFRSENYYVVHPFTEKISGGALPTASRTITVNVLPATDADIDGEGEPNVVWTRLPNGIWVPTEDVLYENMEDSINIVITLRNRGDTEAVVDCNTLSVVDQYQTPVRITSSQITSGCQNGRIVLAPGETRNNILAGITAFAPPGSLGEHTFRITLDYTSAAGVCGGGGAGTLVMLVPFRVEANPYGEGLQTAVYIEPSRITPQNYELDGADVYGTVSVLPDNGVPCHRSGGTDVCATVTLNSLTKYKYIGQLLGRPVYTQSRCSIGTQETSVDNNGDYRFEDVPLTGCEIGLDENGYLQAEVKAEYMSLPGGEGTGSSDINTAIPDLQCEILYELVEATPESERYDFTVRELNDHSIFKDKSYKYDCGTGGGEKGAREPEFACDYEIVGGLEDATRVASFKIDYMKGSTPKTAMCRQAVGLCQIYLN